MRQLVLGAILAAMIPLSAQAQEACFVGSEVRLLLRSSSEV